MSGNRRPAMPGIRCLKANSQGRDATEGKSGRQIPARLRQVAGELLRMT
jgi:hypothetical protein